MVQILHFLSSSPKSQLGLYQTSQIKIQFSFNATQYNSLEMSSKIEENKYEMMDVSWPIRDSPRSIPSHFDPISQLLFRINLAGSNIRDNAFQIEQILVSGVITQEED